MSEAKQVKDDDSAELGSVLQLAPHTPTNKVDTITRGKDGEEYISLDDIYSTTGQEAFQAVVDNCRSYMNSKRLHKSAFTALRIDGVEGLVPGYDRLNSVRGGESFIDSLKKGFVVVIKAVKKFCITVIDWVVLRIRTLLGFEKTEKELAIVNEYSQAVKENIIRLLVMMANVEGVKLDAPELFAALPGNVSNMEAFSLIYNANRTSVEQAQLLSTLDKQLSEAEELIYKAGQRARSSTSRYQQAVRKLEQAFKDKDNFSQADILEFRHALDHEVMEELDPKPLTDMVHALVSKVWGIDLGDIGIESNFKASMQANREAIDKVAAVRMSPELYTVYNDLSKKMSKIILANSTKRFDANQLANLKSLIEVKDAELVQAIEAFLPGSGIITTTYAAYSGSISRYISQLEYLVNIIGQVRRSIAGIINWSNKVDKLMLGYISKDIKTIMAAEDETLTQEAIDGIAEWSTDDKTDPNRKRIGSRLDVDYDALFITKHPKLHGILSAWRGKTSEFRKKHTQLINNINTELKKIGVSQGI